MEGLRLFLRAARREMENRILRWAKFWVGFCLLPLFSFFPLGMCSDCADRVAALWDKNLPKLSIKGSPGSVSLSHFCFVCYCLRKWVNSIRCLAGTTTAVKQKWDVCLPDEHCLIVVFVCVPLRLPSWCVRQAGKQEGGLPVPAARRANDAGTLRGRRARRG